MNDFDEELRKVLIRGMEKYSPFEILHRTTNVATRICCLEFGGMEEHGKI